MATKAVGDLRFGGYALTVAAVVLSCAGASAELRAGRRGAVEEGKATYYAPRLAGHRTANGERYDPAAMTAAHPVLPFGTWVRVTRLDGAKADSRPNSRPDLRPSVVVRINDRCAGGKKIIDLSEAAARRLDMMRAGIVRVRLEVISRGAN
ncbi:MAG: septal ring lytic transglycosylase RlpA family protein [Bacteroidota bacterium]